jgi:hypothetical protein
MDCKGTEALEGGEGLRFNGYGDGKQICCNRRHSRIGKEKEPSGNYEIRVSIQLTYDYKT